MSVKEALLSLVSRTPGYGYQLKNAFEEQTGGLWPLNVGQVYTTLDRLERDGLVEPVGNDAEGRSCFGATKRGRLVARSWFEEPVVRTELNRDELVLKVLIAIANPDIDAAAMVQSQRKILIEELQKLKTIERRMRAEDSPMTLSAVVSQLSNDAVTSRLAADVRWLDLCDERIRLLRSSKSNQNGPTPPTAKVSKPKARP